MFKLLTEEARARVAGEYKLRRIVMILTALILVLTVALIGLFPSYILSKVKQIEAEAGAVIPLSRENEEDLRAWLEDFNRKLDLFSIAIEEEKASAAIEKMIAERRTGVQITQLDWVKSEGATTLSVRGVARDRQTLLSFESGLKDSGHFNQVSLPVSNLAKESDLSFQIDLSIKGTP